MNEFAQTLAVAMLPALGILAGWLIAETVPVSRDLLSLALHGAAGVVLSMVAVKLMPQALLAAPHWLVTLCFVLGGLFFIGLDRVTHHVRGLTGEDAEAGAWGLFVGVAVDLFTDGMMIGSGATVGASLAFLLALGHVPSTIPMGFSSFVAFRKARMPLVGRVGVAAALVLGLFAGTGAGYWALRDQSNVAKMAMLGFTAGALTTLVVEEIVPQAHAERHARFAAFVFVLSFALFALLSTYFEG